ncbi:MAG: hypothetical protein WCW52_04990 [Elusimicrobiales bacterium]
MNSSERGAASTVFMILGPLCAAGLALAAWLGRSYYLLPAAQRPLSELHSRLRPSGTLGLAYGIAGFALIILSLSYLVRSSLVRWDWPGSLRSWMSLHVFTGITGTLFVLLHSSFLLRNPMAALALISLVVVALSGIAGRYIYTRVPRSPQGRELELGELEKAIEEHRRALSEQGVDLPGAPPEGPDAAAQSGVISALTAVLNSDREEALEFENLRRTVLAAPRMAASTAVTLLLAHRFLREKRWLARYHELRELMRVWRFLHRWFSIVMIIFAVFHVLVAVSLGGLGLPPP